MRRRDFIAYGSAAALTTAFVKLQSDQNAEAQATVNFELHMEEIYEEMIDGEVLFALAYRDPVTRAIRPPLYVTEGQRVYIKLVNKTRKARRFAISGLPDDKFIAVAPGATRTITFPSPPAGSYIYHENTEGPVGRCVGLYGGLMVSPANGRTAAGTLTPYTLPTPAQAALFDALGTTDRFPGSPWTPERSMCWMMCDVMPDLNRLVERNLPTGWTTIYQTFAPRYFTLNGLSGYDSSHDSTCCPHGYEGEPMFIRTMNAGMCTHGPHIHGNHVFGLSEVVTDTLKLRKCTNVMEFDTWLLKPLWRKDVLLPYIKPDDIPAAAWPPVEEQFPLFYPMHCHMEMSQTANGGNYPQGLVTHWELLGPRPGV